MNAKNFKMLISFAGRLQNQTVRAVDVHSAMEQVRRTSAEAVCLVKYEVTA